MCWAFIRWMWVLYMLLNQTSEKSLEHYWKAWSAQYGKTWNTFYLNDSECIGWPKLCLCFHFIFPCNLHDTGFYCVPGRCSQAEYFIANSVSEQESWKSPATLEQLLPSSCICIALVSALFLDCSQFLQCFWPFLAFPVSVRSCVSHHA